MDMYLLWVREEMRAINLPCVSIALDLPPSVGSAAWATEVRFILFLQEKDLLITTCMIPSSSDPP